MLSLISASYLELFMSSLSPKFEQKLYFDFVVATYFLQPFNLCWLGTNSEKRSSPYVETVSPGTPLAQSGNKCNLKDTRFS